MSEQPKKKLSRRDAFKILGATLGATVLANLPSKWSKPEVISGVLPAHAQTSFGLSCDTGGSVSEPSNSSYVSGTTINLPASGIVMRWSILLNNVTLDNGADPITGTAITNGSGYASINTPNVSITDPTQNASVTVNWSFDDVSQGVFDCDQVFVYTVVLPTVGTTSIVDPSGIGAPAEANFVGEVFSIGSTPVTDRGFVWGTTSNPTLPSVNSVSVGAGGIGPFTAPNVNIASNTYYGRAYATNAGGTAYGDDIQFTTQICLVEGTLVVMADGTTKKIEDIKYSDWIQVWNFDEGRLDEAQPLWIKKVEIANEYNLVKFSDGTSLKTVNDHRIFNKEQGKFTYPAKEDASMGSTTFNVNGEEVTLVDKSIVREQVNYYNVITDRHMNLFANGILTSCRYNNIYPIKDMKFVKDERGLIPQEEYGVEERFYAGLRLAEQDIPVADTMAYVSRLKKNDVEAELELVL